MIGDDTNQGPRHLSELEDDASGQLATEWILVTGLLVMPMIILIPSFLAMIRTYFYRVAEVVHLPFP